MVLRITLLVTVSYMAGRCVGHACLENRGCDGAICLIYSLQPFLSLAQPFSAFGITQQSIFLDEQRRSRPPLYHGAIHRGRQCDLISSFVFTCAMNVFCPKLARKAGLCLSVFLVLKNCRERVTGGLRLSLNGATVNYKNVDRKGLEKRRDGCTISLVIA